MPQAASSFGQPRLMSHYCGSGLAIHGALLPTQVGSRTRLPRPQLWPRPRPRRRSARSSGCGAEATMRRAVVCTGARRRATSHLLAVEGEGSIRAKCVRNPRRLKNSSPLCVSVPSFVLTPHLPPSETWPTRPTACGRRCRPRCSRRRRALLSAGDAHGRGAATQPAKFRAWTSALLTSDVRADQHCMTAARHTCVVKLRAYGCRWTRVTEVQAAAAAHACGRAGFQRWRRSTEVCTLAHSSCSNRAQLLPTIRPATHTNPT